jgi:hypothetical protein
MVGPAEVGVCRVAKESTATTKGAGGSGGWRVAGMRVVGMGLLHFLSCRDGAKMRRVVWRAALAAGLL